jgi:hypothetical protein
VNDVLHGRREVGCSYNLSEDEAEVDSWMKMPVVFVIRGRSILCRETEHVHRDSFFVHSPTSVWIPPWDMTSSVYYILGVYTLSTLTYVTPIRE